MTLNNNCHLNSYPANSSERSGGRKAPLTVPGGGGAARGSALRSGMLLPQARDLIGMDITNSVHVIISHGGKAGDIGAGIWDAPKHRWKDHLLCFSPDS